MEKYDFSGWATRHGLKCSDGRTIMPEAFKHCDGVTVPLVWSHQHTKPDDVLGHALLEYRDEGVYTYGSFNDTEQGVLAKALVKHGDITALSIYANQLQQDSSKRVMHGQIREVSLVHAGANPGAYIQEVLIHSADGEFIREVEDECIIHSGEDLELYHAEENKEKEVSKMEDEKKEVKEEPGKEKTVKDVFDEFTDEQKTVVYALIGQALEDAENEKKEDSQGGTEPMKHNAFENDGYNEENVLTHADQKEIIELAKKSSVGSLKQAIAMYTEDNESLAHGVFTDADVTTLFSEFKNLNPGEPDIIGPDQSWVPAVINKIKKSPYSRVRTRQADARQAELKAKGYQKKGDQKKLMNDIKLLGRTTDPQTIYIKDEIHRDDIIDIEDFDYVNFQWKVMDAAMKETLALAALVGDGRDEGDADKIHETHIRSIYNDEELYTMHVDVNIEKARQELQGTDTNVNFGENYIYAEAIITAALYSREKYKGTGTPDLYCAPHLVNVMLLARDMNGRRIYDSKADLAKALNVGTIHEIEQLEGRTRTTDDGDNKKLLGLFVNLSDYQFGCAKGGQVTRFDDFDIDFNRQKFLMETRLSGALVKPFAAIALEEPVNA